MSRTAKLILYACLSLLALSRASAEWHPEYGLQPQKVQDWYKKQELNPDTKLRLNVSWQSCCEHSDVVKTRFRVERSRTNDKWDEDIWYYLDGNTWRRVPPDTVHENAPTPDGQPVMFAYQGTITCFYAGDTGG